MRCPLCQASCDVEDNTQARGHQHRGIEPKGDVDEARASVLAVAVGLFRSLQLTRNPAHRHASSLPFANQRAAGHQEVERDDAPSPLTLRPQNPPRVAAATTCKNILLNF